MKEALFTTPVKKARKYGRKLKRVANEMRWVRARERKLIKYEENFDLEQELQEMNTPVIEVGGPTDYSWHVTDILNSDQKILVSNIDRFDLNDSYGNGRFVADAGQLPLEDESVGALYSAFLNFDARERFITEAYRVVRLGGLLIIAGCIDEDMAQAETLGFNLTEVIQYSTRGYPDERIYDVVFRKGEIPTLLQQNLRDVPTV